MVENRDTRLVRIVVYVMLVLSAGTSVFFGDRLWTAAREGSLPLWAPLLAPAAFTAFVVVYTVDRWLLVRRHHYPLTRALFQVAFALVFLTLLLPQQASELRQLRRAEVNIREPAMLLLAHPEAGVRAATCELLSGRIAGDVYQRVLEVAHNDVAPQVRESCSHAIGRLRPLE